MPLRVIDCFPHHRSLIGISNANGSSEAQAAFRQSLRERAEAERLALQGVNVKKLDEPHSCIIGTLPP
jgi:hypothetical protein